MLHHNQEVAERNKALIEEHYKKYKPEAGCMEAYSLKLYTDSGEEFTLSVPWTGFFESLTMVEIERVEIL